MSETTSTLKIKLLAEGDLHAIREAKEQAEQLEHVIETLHEAMAALGVGFSLEGLVEGAKASAEYALNLKKLADAADIGVEAFQRLSYTALEAHLSQDELGTGLNVLQKNMAEAATGASKQINAIQDLGLSTAELLAMPVEDQVKAIAEAYDHAADKGRAWADVIALLGKNAATFRAFLSKEAHGGGEGGPSLSGADIQRLEHAEEIAKRIGAGLLVAGGEFVSKIAGALEWAERKHRENYGIPEEAAGEPAKKPAEADVKAEQARLEAAVASNPKIIALNLALAKSEIEVGRAAESSAETVRRLREQAAAEADAAKLILAKPDLDSQEAGKSMILESRRTRAEADRLELADAREKQRYVEKLLDLYHDIGREQNRNATFDQQITAAKAREVELAQESERLDLSTKEGREANVRNLEKLKQLQTEIYALESSRDSKRVEDASHAAEIQNRVELIRLAAIEADYTKTDTEKWYEKRDVLREIVKEQQEYVDAMRKLSNDPSLTKGAREKAGNLAESGQAAAAGTKGQIAGMGADPHSFTQTFSADLTRLKSQWGTLEQQVSHGLTGTISTGFNSLSQNLTKSVMGAQTLGQAFRSVAQDIEQSLLGALVEIGVQMLENAVLSKIIHAEEKKDTKEQTSAKIVEAGLASIASLGPLLGGAIFAAELAALVAISGGFEDGGYTGGTEGQAAGIVHGQEFVWSAPAVRAVGRENLSAWHAAAVTGGSVRPAGGGSAGAAGGGREMVTILVQDPESLAATQRQYVDARVHRVTNRMPKVRHAL